MTRKMPVDDQMDLDTFEVTTGENGWVTYHWPEFRGKRVRFGWNRIERRFAWGADRQPLACVNVVLQKELLGEETENAG